MNDWPSVLIKAFPWSVKVFAAIMGAIFALVLSKDINSDGQIKINLRLIINFTFSVSISIFGGSAIIEHFNLASKSSMTHAFIFLMSAVLGMLIVGIIYQSISLMNGKSLSEIVREVKAAFFAIFKD